MFTSSIRRRRRWRRMRRLRKKERQQKTEKGKSFCKRKQMPRPFCIAQFRFGSDWLYFVCLVAMCCIHAARQ